MLRRIVLRAFNNDGDRIYIYAFRVGKDEYKLLGADREFLVQSIYCLGGIVDCLNTIVSKYSRLGHTITVTIEVVDPDLSTRTSPIPDGLCLKNVNQLDVRYWRE